MTSFLINNTTSLSSPLPPTPLIPPNTQQEQRQEEQKPVTSHSFYQKCTTLLRFLSSSLWFLCVQWAQHFFPWYHNRHDLKLLAYSFVYGLVSMYLSCLAIAYADKIYWEQQFHISSPLLDPGLTWLHTLAKKLNISAKITDYMVYLSLLFIFSRIFTARENSVLLLRRFLYITTTIYLIRAPTILMTVLPSPYKECENKRYSNLFLDAFFILIQEHAGCGDVFFSGHSIFINYAARVWLEYSDLRWMHVLTVCSSVFGLASLVFTSFHYSIDVLYATIMVNIVFSLYHWIAKGKIGSQRFWARALRYLDGGASFSKQASEMTLNEQNTLLSLPSLPSRKSFRTSHSSSAFELSP